jgi:hypothetical protein
MPHDFRDGASPPYTSTLGTLAIAIAMAFTVTSPWLSCAAGASRARRTCFKVVAHAIDVSIEGIVTQAYGPSSSSLALEMLTRILG